MNTSLTRKKIQKIIQEEINAVLSEQDRDKEMEIAIASGLEGVDGLTPEQKENILVSVAAALKTAART
mgnify:CR=1 FL=1